MIWNRLTLVCATLLLAGCPSGEDLARVTLRTDLVPGVDFDEAHVSIELPEEEVLEASVTPARGADLVERTLLMVESELPLGLYAGQVELTNARGVVLSRTVSFEVFRQTTVGVLLTSDCTRVECEEGQACFRGECVSDGCSSADRALCGASECNIDSDCTGLGECELPVCINGWCLAQKSPGMCDEGQYCSPRGCAAL